MNTRSIHTPERPLPYIERPTFAPERTLPSPDPSTVPTAILPRPDPVDAAVAALRGINDALDNAARAIAPLTPDQYEDAVEQVPPHPRLLADPARK